MKKNFALSYFWKSTILTFAILMNITFGYSLFVGKQNIFVWRGLHDRHLLIMAELEEVDADKENISKQIRLLQSDSSYIEKLIRQRLNYVREDEVLYIFDKEREEDSLWLDDGKG